MKKKALVLMMAAVLGICSAGTAFAGEWTTVGEASWQKRYVEEDGSYTTDNWQNIDGKWYHFDSDGCLDIGFRTFDGENWYNLMGSGAMETSHDYGPGAIDENGVWKRNEEAALARILEISEREFTTGVYSDGKEGMYADYCRSYGIDVDAFFAGLERGETSYSWSGITFPRDLEGGIAPFVIMETLYGAIEEYGAILQSPTIVGNCNYQWDEAAGTFGITYEVVDLTH